MMLLVIVGALGIIVGMNIKQERLTDQYDKTLEQVDAKLRKDLQYYKNLSESLTQDVRFLREKLERLKK